jgi:hypothetical protein
MLLVPLNSTTDPIRLPKVKYVSKIDTLVRGSVADCLETNGFCWEIVCTAMQHLLLVIAL